MTRFLNLTTILVFAAVPMAQAAAQATTAPDQQAKYADAALKSCNYDLDHDHFGSYGTIDECVADRTQKMAREDQAKSGAAHAPKPN